jgi:hypothetical protein
LGVVGERGVSGFGVAGGDGVWVVAGRKSVYVAVCEGDDAGGAVGESAFSLGESAADGVVGVRVFGVRGPGVLGGVAAGGDFGGLWSHYVFGGVGDAMVSGLVFAECFSRGGDRGAEAVRSRGAQPR